MKKHTLAAGMLAAVILASCTKNIDTDVAADESSVGAPNPHSQAQEQGASGNHVPNELLVKFKAGTSDAQKAAAFGRMNAQVQERIVTAAMKRSGDNEGVYLLRSSLQAMEAVGRGRGVEVEYAEPNWIYTHGASSTDTYYTNGTLWGMQGGLATQFGCDADAAWAVGHTGSINVVIGVIDEGIQFTHPDLDANVWTNPYDKADGVDNDGNGYVDDIHGWDFDRNDNSVYDGGSSGGTDDHGTHVAGTIGAESNGTGVVGVNWNVTMISAKFLGRRGGTLSNAIKAVDYFTDLKTRHGLNIPATNNSWGGGGFSQALKDAIDRAGAKEILFVAAAGNDGRNNDVTASYPSGYTSDNIISVAAIDKAGALASFSNYGATTVDIGAPGVSIMSTTAFNTYSSYNGTSMATPHVTGGVALFAAHNPTSSAATIKAAILDRGTATGTLAGKCVTGDRLNVSTF